MRPAQRPMGVVVDCRPDPERLVPPRQKLVVEISVGLLQRLGMGHSQALDQPILCRANPRSTRPLACGECAAIHSISSSFSARPICVGDSGTPSLPTNSPRFVLGVLTNSVALSV